MTQASLYHFEFGLKVKEHVESVRDIERHTALADDVADMLQWFLVPDLPCLQLDVKWLWHVLHVAFAC